MVAPLVDCFGDAPFLGSLGADAPVKPVVALVPTPSGRGYRLVGADGGVFAFGDAVYLGSTAGTPPVAPIVGAAATRSGAGYWPCRQRDANRRVSAALAVAESLDGVRALASADHRADPVAARLPCVDAHPGSDTCQVSSPLRFTGTRRLLARDVDPDPEAQSWG